MRIYVSVNNVIPENGEILSEKSKVEPWYLKPEEQINRLILSGQRLIDVRKYEYIANQEIPEDVTVLGYDIDIVDVMDIRKRLVAKLMQGKQLEEAKKEVLEVIDEKNKENGNINQQGGEGND